MLFVSTKLAELTVFEMNVAQKQLKLGVKCKPLVAGLMLGLFLFVLAMANFKAVHCALHDDAEKVDHQCVVSLLAGGQIDTASGTVSVSKVSPPAFQIATPKLFVVVAVDYSLLPSRGPPAAV